MLTHGLDEKRTPSRIFAVLVTLALTIGLGAAGPGFGTPARAASFGFSHRQLGVNLLAPPAALPTSAGAEPSVDVASLALQPGFGGAGAGAQRGGPAASPSLLRVQQAGTISGFVIDTSGRPVGGVSVQLLDASQNLLASTLTDAFGAYAFFSGVTGGTYLIRVVPPAGFTVQSVSPGAPATSTGGNGILITNFSPLTSYANNNFILGGSAPLPPQNPSISGSVIQDVNGNRLIDVPPDRAIAGVQILLQNLSGSTLASTTTDGSGAWAFTNLSPGTYRVSQVVPANFAAVNAFPGPGGTAISATTLQVTVSTGASGNNNFLDTGTVVSPTVGTISGFVIRDVDNNGFINVPPDVPLAGVTIQLYLQSGTFVAQTTTGSNGAYAFTNVPPGFYQVLQLVPRNLVSEGPNPLAVTAIADVNQGNNNFLDRAVVAQPAGTISGSVVQDVNGNNLVDVPPDARLSGVQVLLQTPFGTTLRSTTTDVNGAWAFNNLAAGTYNVVQVVPANFAAIAAFPGPGGVALSATTLQVSIGTGGASGNNNFLDRATVVSPTVGTISGSVIQDANGNGVIDTGDVPIPGVQVQLFTQLGTFVAQAATDSTGAYAFTNVPPGFYQVVQQVPLGLVSVAAIPGVNGSAVAGSTSSLNVTVAAGVNSSGNNFLDRLPQQFSSISGSVIRDVNGNGIVDVPPDVPIAGVQILLQTQFGSTLQATTTDVNGAWAFNNLAPGTYLVVQVVPANFTPFRAFAGPGSVSVSSTTFQVTVSGTVPVSSRNNFLDRGAVVSPTVGTISGFVIQDVDGNGFINVPPDVPLAGVQIQLFTQTGVFIAQAITGSNGAYAFINVPPGFYQVLQIVPSGFVSLGPNPLAVTAIADVNQGNNNFLDRATVFPQTGTISGSVVQDIDGNGFVNVPPDRPISGVQVLLQTLAGQTLQSFTTDVNGAWAFRNLSPGTFNIVQVVPANFAAVGAFPGPGGVALSTTTLQVTIAAGGTSGNNNFLDRGAVVSPTVGTISGFVIQDVDGNGFINVPPDVPLAGVPVQLFTQTGVFIAQTTTGGNGAYAFINVPPGFYQVLQIVPSGFVSLGPNPLAVTAIADVNQGNNNFLDRAVVTTGLNTISGFTIRDVNLNGQPNNEPALAGMLVVISDRFGNPLASVVTNASGIFRFINVPAGTFILTARPPVGEFSTNAIPGLGGTRLSANSIAVTTTPGITNYPGQFFLAGP